MSRIKVIFWLLLSSWSVFSEPSEPSESLKKDMIAYQHLEENGVFIGQDPAPSWHDSKIECTTNHVKFESSIFGAYFRLNHDPKNEFIANSVVSIENGTHQFTLIEGNKEQSITVRLDNRWKKEPGFCRLRVH